MGQSLLIISLLPKSSFQILMAPKKNDTNKLVAMIGRANPIVYPTTSTSIGVPNHPYDIRKKIRTLVELYGPTLPVLNNPIYNISIPHSE